MKRIGLLGVTLCLVFAIGTVSCKSKQSAYKAAYEQAKEREISSDEPTDEEIAPVTKSKDSGETRQEKITPVEGEDADAIKLYSVVVGSFKNRTNAFSLKERMQNEGYTLAKTSKACSASSSPASKPKLRLKRAATPSARSIAPTSRTHGFWNAPIDLPWPG